MVDRPRGNRLSPAERAFRSPAARALKAEIVRTGRKLWERHYVDGNGGNITGRLTDEWVISTPTMLSKADLSADDLCLVDLAGNQLAGRRRHSSELPLHLAIFKAQPRARAVVHCHPPYATTFALVHRVPPVGMLAEHEVFVGPVPCVPYETPGTRACADAVVPFVEDHNTILLANHGIVCWGDTVTHAEWYVEVMETTCRILILSSQLGQTPKPIPATKIADLLSMKQSLGLPDARLRGIPSRRRR